MCSEALRLQFGVSQIKVVMDLWSNKSEGSGLRLRKGLWFCCSDAEQKWLVGLVKNTSSNPEKILGRALFMMLSMDDDNLNKNFIICGIFTLELSYVWCSWSSSQEYTLWIKICIYSGEVLIGSLLTMAFDYMVFFAILGFIFYIHSVNHFAVLDEERCAY